MDDETSNSTEHATRGLRSIGRVASIRSGIVGALAGVAIGLGCGSNERNSPETRREDQSEHVEARGAGSSMSGAFDDESGEDGGPEDDWLCSAAPDCAQRVMDLGEVSDDGISPEAVLEQIAARSVRLTWAIDRAGETRLTIRPLDVEAAQIVERHGRDCEQPHNFSVGFCPGGLSLTTAVEFETEDGLVKGRGQMRVTVDVPNADQRGLYMIDAGVGLQASKGSLRSPVKIGSESYEVEYLDIACSGFSTTPEDDMPECWVHGGDGVELAVTRDD